MTSRPRKLCLSVDFDGVLHSYDKPWAGPAIIPDPPVLGAIAWLVENRRHFDIHIFSSRSRSLRGRRAMKRYLVRHVARHFMAMGICATATDAEPCSCWTGCDIEQCAWLGAHHMVHKEIRWPWLKPPAHLTIDDRAVTFDGDWSKLTPEAVRKFRPWNKRPDNIR